MADEMVDVVELLCSSSEVEERLIDVQTILGCLQSLTDHIAYLEHELIVKNSVVKNSENHFDLGLIRYQMWLSEAFQKIMRVERELEWTRYDLYRSEDPTTQLPTDSKCILDESLSDSLATPLKPERLWTDQWNVSMAPRIIIPDNKGLIDHTDYKNHVEKVRFQKMIDQLRHKLEMKEEPSHKCPITYDSRANNLLKNFRSLEGNITEIKQSLSLLEKDIQATPTKYESNRKKDCAGNVTELEASKKNYEDGLGQQKTMNTGLQTVHENRQLKGVVGEVKPLKSLRQSVTHKHEIAKPRWSVAEKGRKRRGGASDRQSIPKNLERLLNIYNDP